MEQNSTVIKYLIHITCDQKSKNYVNVQNDCLSRFPKIGYLEVDDIKQFYKEAKNNGWGNHGWDYWRCPSCEKL